jgi:hypothetical protein
MFASDEINRTYFSSCVLLLAKSQENLPIKTKVPIGTRYRIGVRASVGSQSRQATVTACDFFCLRSTVKDPLPLPFHFHFPFPNLIFPTEDERTMEKNPPTQAPKFFQQKREPWGGHFHPLTVYIH